MNDKIQEAVERFTVGLAAILRDHIQEALGEVGRQQATVFKGASQPPRPAKKTAAKKKKKNKKNKKKARTYRSSEELDDVKQTVTQALKRNRRGLRTEELSLLTEVPTKGLRLPLLQMRADGVVRTSGSTRATVYILR